MYGDYVTTVSSLSQCTLIRPGNHPPYTPDSEKTLPLPSPLQQSLDWYISVHSNESQQFVVSTISFGWKLARSVGIIASMLRCCFPFNLLLFIWATIPPTLFNLKKTFPITSAGVLRSVHFSAPQCNLTMNHLFWMTISTKFELSSLRCVEHLSLIFTGWSDKVSIVFMVKPLVF